MARHAVPLRRPAGSDEKSSMWIPCSLRIPVASLIRNSPIRRLEGELETAVGGRALGEAARSGRGLEAVAEKLQAVRHDCHAEGGHVTACDAGRESLSPFEVRKFVFQQVEEPEHAAGDVRPEEGEIAESPVGPVLAVVIQGVFRDGSEVGARRRRRIQSRT